MIQLVTITISFTAYFRYIYTLYKFSIVVITVFSYVSEMEEGRLHIPLPHVTKGPYKGNFWNIFIKDMNKLKSDPTTKFWRNLSYCKSFGKNG